jgi:acetyl-CoA carboxylase carboxyl transferase subunit alpha
MMMQYSVYAVISPEGCAAILWSDGTRGPEAAEALKLTSMDIDSLGTVIDDVIPEPDGGAHNDHVAAAAKVKEYLVKHLEELKQLSPEDLVEQRYQKFRAMTVIDE